jgi:hypothetical protein
VGKLVYGDAHLSIEFEDRVLAHLQLVIGSKLRRGEGFFFSWRDDPAVGDGRSSIWLQTSMPLYFSYSSAGRVTINRAWLEELTKSANAPQGLFLLDEPGEETPRPKSYV